MKNAEYEAMIRAMDWPDLAGLHAAITAHDTAGWEPGEALEYLIRRLFELDGARVRWTYEIKMGGQIVAVGPAHDLACDARWGEDDRFFRRHRPDRGARV